MLKGFGKVAKRWRYFVVSNAANRSALLSYHQRHSFIFTQIQERVVEDPRYVSPILSVVPKISIHVRKRETFEESFSGFHQSPIPILGKTETLAVLLRCLTVLGKKTLLISHTHSAVDNVLLRLLKVTSVLYLITPYIFRKSLPLSDSLATGLTRCLGSSLSVWRSFWWPSFAKCCLRAFQSICDFLFTRSLIKMPSTFCGISSIMVFFRRFGLVLFASHHLTSLSTRKIL